MQVRQCWPALISRPLGAVFVRCGTPRDPHPPALLKRERTEGRKGRESFTSIKMLRTHTETFTQRRFYTQRSFYTQQAFTQNLLHTARFYRKKFLHREAFLYIITAGIAAPKPDLDAKAKKDNCGTLFNRNVKRKIASARIEKIY